MVLVPTLNVTYNVAAVHALSGSLPASDPGISVTPTDWESKRVCHEPSSISRMPQPYVLSRANGAMRRASSPASLTRAGVAGRGSPARLPDYDDSRWEVCQDITAGRSHGFTFAWYRITVTLPETVQGREVRGTRLLFETCIDDYGEIWINGACDRERGAVQGFNTPQRVLVTTDPQPGQRYTIALLAVNGPLGEPGGWCSCAMRPWRSSGLP